MEEIEEKQKKKQRILNIIILVGISVIAICIGYMIYVQVQYKKAEESYDKLKNQYVTEEDNGIEDNNKSEKQQETKEEPGIQVDLKGLQAKNPDVVGWIYYEPAGISYPIVQDEDNTYYIKHTYAGEKNSAGSIFMDAWNQGDFSDRNTFIYGHNMRNGTMFGSLKNIRKKGTIQKHPCFWIMTEQGWQQYDIFSYYEADTSEKSFTIQFENDAEYETFLKDIKKRSEENLHVDVQTKDQIVTLSTCTSDHSVRFLVHGKLVQ